jgi:hypothetical protein
VDFFLFYYRLVRVLQRSRIRRELGERERERLTQKFVVRI